MSSTNIIFTSPYVTPVIINISGITTTDGSPIDLNDFSKITAQFGDDIRDSVNNPDDVVIQTGSELRLFFNDTTEKGSKYWIISGTYNGEEIPLSNKCKYNLCPTSVCT